MIDADAEFEVQDVINVFPDVVAIILRGGPFPRQRQNLSSSSPQKKNLNEGAFCSVEAAIVSNSCTQKSQQRSKDILVEDETLL